MRRSSVRPRSTIHHVKRRFFNVLAGISLALLIASAAAFAAGPRLLTTITFHRFTWRDSWLVRQIELRITSDARFDAQLFERSYLPRFPDIGVRVPAELESGDFFAVRQGAWWGWDGISAEGDSSWQVEKERSIASI